MLLDGRGGMPVAEVLNAGGAIPGDGDEGRRFRSGKGDEVVQGVFATKARGGTIRMMASESHLGTPV